MTNKREYKPGVRYGWPGGECPVDGDTEVEFETRNGHRAIGSADSCDWRDAYGDSSIIAFTILSQPKPTTYTVTVEVKGIASMDGAHTARSAIMNCKILSDLHMKFEITEDKP